MSATPVRNRRDGLWAQLDLVHPGRWGNYFEFTRLFCGGTHNAYNGWDAKGRTNTPLLKARLAPIRHVVNYEIVRASLPPLRRMMTRLSPEDLSRGVDRKREAAALRKRLGGPRGQLEYQLRLVAGRKHPYVLDTVEDEVLLSEKKCVIFTGRRADCEVLGEKVTKLAAKLVGSGSLKTAPWVQWAHGELDSKRREQLALDYLQAQGPAVLIGTGDAFGEGMDLHDTDRAIFTMLPWTPGQIEQWEGRFIRQGMGKKPCVIVEYVIAEKTVDEHISDLLLSKLPDVDQVVGNGAVAGLSGALSGAGEEEMLAALVARISSTDVAD